MSGDMQPINGNLFPPHITSGKKRNPNAKLFADKKAADIEYEQWRRNQIYAIYGRQWDEMPKTRRGRA